MFKVAGDFRIAPTTAPDGVMGGVIYQLEADHLR
jgi:hypothetical protein